MKLRQLIILFLLISSILLINSTENDDDIKIDDDDNIGNQNDINDTDDNDDNDTDLYNNDYNDYNYNDSDFNYSDYNYNDSEYNGSYYDDDYYGRDYDDPYGRYDGGGDYNYEDEQRKYVACSLIVQEAMKNNRQQLKDVINRIKKTKSKTIIEKIKFDLCHYCVQNITKEIADKYLNFYETTSEIELEDKDKELINIDYDKYQTAADLASDYSIENDANEVRDAEDTYIESHPKFIRLFNKKKNNDDTMEVDPKYKNRAFLMIIGIIAISVLCMFGNLYVEKKYLKEKEN